MCGIFAIYHPVGCAKFVLERAKRLSWRQLHRGPDYRGAYQHPRSGNILCHERLAIMDLNCVQPLRGSCDDHQVIHNGEIYNHKRLRENELAECSFRTHCDSEAIIFLYEKYRDSLSHGQMCNMLDGVFAFALIFGDDFFVARDPIGVKPLYYGIDTEGRHLFSSEMKVIEDICGNVFLQAFPPGHYFSPDEGLVQYYKPVWFHAELAIGCPSAYLVELRQALIDATNKRLMSDAPIGVLLSGGLDSSLISAIATRRMRGSGARTIRSFSIGVDASSPDLIAARRISEFLGTEHYEVHFTIQEGLSVLRQLVWHLESYDVTSIRASTPMFLLSRRIAELGVKVVLSGEGADEIFGGYLYFHNAPDADAFQRECIRRVQLLSTADCLRADKSCMAHAVEVRVPFLDKRFLDIAMLTAPEHRRPQLEGGRFVEKWLLRKAFDVSPESDTDSAYIPREILWRQKEQFSDGVGYGWIDSLMAHCASAVSDEEMANASVKFPHNTPTTREAYYMRRLFHEQFPSAAAAATVHTWVPRWQASADPSGRASHVHVESRVDQQLHMKNRSERAESTPADALAEENREGEVAVHANAATINGLGE